LKKKCFFCVKYQNIPDPNILEFFEIGDDFKEVFIKGFFWEISERFYIEKKMFFLWKISKYT